MSKGPIARGTLGSMVFNTVFGKVNADIEFLHTGADGIPLAQAFRFLGMDDTSSRRFESAAQQMQEAGFSDAEENESSLGGLATQLSQSIRRLASALSSSDPSRTRS